MAWAINAALIEFMEVGVPLGTDALPLRAAEPPPLDPALVEKAVPVPAIASTKRRSYRPGEVGRDHLLAEITRNRRPGITSWVGRAGGIRR
jgi:hypothetical protein